MPSFLLRFAETFWAMLYEMAPFLVLGVLAAGLVHESLGRCQKLGAFARKRSFSSLTFFNFSGVLLPMCSCGTVPMAVGMRHQGVALGNIFSFIFSAPATSVAAIILALAMLGKQFTLWYLTGAVVCSYAIGLFFFLIEPEEFSQQSGYLPCRTNGGNGEEESKRPGPFLLRSIHWSTTVYGGRIAFDLILGLLLVSALVSMFSLTALSAWLNGMPFLLAGLVMILLAIPMYICSLPGIMLAATMVLGGIKPEYVWIFLMAGPVTNLGDINVLRKSMGGKATILYAFMVAVLSVAWAYLIHIGLDWMDVWGHVRHYFAQQPLLASEYRAESLWRSGSILPGWPLLYWGSSIAVILLVTNGAYLTIREFVTNPCLHCVHFQADMTLSPVLCKEPCWKKNLLRFLKKKPPYSRRKWF